MSVKDESTRRFGKRQELLAENFLYRKGFKLIQRNYLCRLGEIDLIMIDKHRQLVFVEVRYRSQALFGSALDSITREKQRKIRTCATHFLMTHKKFNQLACRFDVIAISPSSKTTSPIIKWIKNAFF
ncbi:MAG: YraN family protein [SAR86 cluster bacterium]|uniref:UPF0102 protein COA96_08075 n=1 Tax=SAR86 cluster bacterium TaxID=2030880 RepID=A0A2A5B0L9_9GAMM|nr:MAG: YraN family protein [SAR86 cluster bacterium]